MEAIYRVVMVNFLFILCLTSIEKLGTMFETNSQMILFFEACNNMKWCGLI